jgi:hypothetical protein
MRPALERLQHIEHQLLGQPTAAQVQQWQVQLLTDPELAPDAQAQQQLYQALQQAGRQQLRRELDLIHARFSRAEQRRGWLRAATDKLRQVLTLRLKPGH